MYLLGGHCSILNSIQGERGVTASGHSVFWSDGSVVELGYTLKGWNLQDVNCISFGLKSSEPLNSTWPGAAPTNLTSYFCTVHAGELGHKTKTRVQKANRMQIPSLRRGRPKASPRNTQQGGGAFPFRELR